MEITPAVPIDQIRAPMDRFRCEPYKSVMFARACIERQAMSEKPLETRGGDYVFCVGCKDGARVRGKLRLLPASALIRKAQGEDAAPGKRRRPQQRRKNAAAPKPAVVSEATKAAVAALPKELPKKPPTSKLRAVAPPAPAESAAVRALRREIGAVESGLRGIEAKARAMVSDVRRTRERFARKR